MKNLFSGPIGAYQRGWFGFLFEISLSQYGQEQCTTLFRKFPDIDSEIIVDLLKYLCGAGLMEGAENSTVSYDGSRIDHVVGREVDPEEKHVFLRDFCVLRSENRATLEEGLLSVEAFLRENRNLLQELSNVAGSFWEVYPFGIFRCESLLSMMGVKEMTITQYLRQLSLNLQERKRLFGESFSLVHRSTGILFDHDPKRNVFRAEGPYWNLGEVVFGKRKKKVFLRMGLGDGEGYMGMSLAITIEDPRAAFFKVAYQLVAAEDGSVVPQFITAQVSPMQINRNFDFVEGFLPHAQFPDKDPTFQLQAAVTKLLGGGNVFDTMIVALINYYRAQGYSTFSGIKGEDNLWLKHHADEVVERRSGAEQMIAARARKLYCERFERLGFTRVNGWWASDNFLKTMKAALLFRRTGTRKAKLPCRCGGQETLRRVELPVVEVCAAESGLAMLGEILFSELPLSGEGFCAQETCLLLELLRSARQHPLALCHSL